MNKERVGALTDGIYAIAMTILVLELPLPDASQKLGESFLHIFGHFLSYGLTFLLLFGFWYNQRRINELLEEHTRPTLWLNGLALMFVCLLPFAASLLYHVGNVSSSILDLNYAVFVDLLFIAICFLTDISIHLVLHLVSRRQSPTDAHRHHVYRVKRSRQIATLIVIVAMFITLVVPGPNRNTLIAIPLLLIFEDEVVRLVDWLRRQGLKALRN